MDYLNYGNKVQQKPQGFGQQKVELNKNDFSFGNLNSQSVSSPVEPKTKDELMQLFPVPILISSYPFDYSKELEWIKKQPDSGISNSLNKTSLNRQSEDTFILDNPEMSRVRQFIDSKLKEFVSNIMGSDAEMVITQSWLNRNGKGELHHEHTHPNSMVSGVWYPQINEKLPPIQFKTGQQIGMAFPIKKYNYYNSETFLLPLKKGELILFPSTLSHSVPINRSDEERISLSFNTWCKGSLGNINSLTYLPLERCV